MTTGSSTSVGGRAPLSKRGFTLVELLVVVVVLAVIASLIIPPIARSFRHDKVRACADNFRKLHVAQQTYISLHPGVPHPLGMAYWVALTRTSPPLIEPSQREILTCPVLGDPDAGDCQYLGPAADAGSLGPTDPLGCDLVLNHSETGAEGGNVLLKSGAVVTDNTRDTSGVWGSAVFGSKCRP